MGRRQSTCSTSSDPSCVSPWRYSCWCSPSALSAQEGTSADCPPILELTTEDELFASIRHYEGIQPADYPEINAYSRDKFLPILAQAPGFRFYATMNQSDASLITAVNVFTSEAEMQEANALAAQHVAANLAPLFPNAPIIFNGAVQLLVYANRCPTEDSAEDSAASAPEATPSPGYLGYRVYADYADLEADLETINQLVSEQFAPALASTDGFLLYLFLLLPEYGGTVALNIFASQDALAAANELAAQYVADELADLSIGPPSIYGGTVAVLDLSGLFASEESVEEKEE